VSARDQITSLVQSEGRVHVLLHLAEQPRRQVDLAALCSVSRPSVSRYLADFTAHGWVIREEDTYHLTAGGHRILETYSEMAENVRFVRSYAKLINRLGDYGTTIPEEAVRDAKVVHSDSSNPHPPMEYLIDVLLSADLSGLRGVVPTYTPLLKEPLERLLRQAETAEIRIPQGVADRMRNSTYCEIDPYAEDLFTVDERFSGFDFGVLLLEEQVLVFTKPAQDAESVCLHGRSAELYDWAVDVFEQRREHDLSGVADDEPLP
jgi:predicted transcriptional regulator